MKHFYRTFPEPQSAIEYRAAQERAKYDAAFVNKLHIFDDINRAKWVAKHLGVQLRTWMPPVHKDDFQIRDIQGFRTSRGTFIDSIFTDALHNGGVSLIDLRGEAAQTECMLMITQAFMRMFSCGAHPLCRLGFLIDHTTNLKPF